METSNIHSAFEEGPLISIMFADSKHLGGFQDSGITLLSKTNNHKPHFLKTKLIE